MTRVLVIDDHPIVFQGCRTLLNEIGVTDIVERRCRAGGYRAFLKGKPDIVISDLSFYGDNVYGLDLVARMATADPTAAVLVFSMHDDPTIVARAMAAGAKGYALKDSGSAVLASALRAMLDGVVFVDPHVTLGLIGGLGQPNNWGKLSPREEQVMSLLRRGCSMDDISAKLEMPYKTIVNITGTIRSKLGIASFADLLKMAMSR